MHYITRPGVVRVKICDTFLLVPDRKASEFCKGVVPLKFLGAITWGIIFSHHPIEEVYSLCQTMSNRPEDEVREKVDAFLADLYEKGFLIRVEDEE